jgi:hypothetical protein
MDTRTFGSMWYLPGKAPEMRRTRSNDPRPDAGPGCLHAGCGLLIGTMLGAGIGRVFRRIWGIDSTLVVFLIAALFCTAAGFWKDRLWRWLGL